MKLSIVIVNYNVSSFLEQCLLSIARSQDIKPGIDTEVFVVDNASVDDSVEIVKKNFPWVTLVENKVNVGFAKANNQAINVSTGEYVLLLNPDTVLEEDTLKVCLDFMKNHPQAGGLGVKMLDGNGRFLPESKRGLPTPQTAFFKIIGFCRLFPTSKRYAHYYMGHLDKDSTHEIEVLSGAFMMMPKQVLDNVGLLDESFFMYGEDIDLSYRITLGGYKNYYLAQARIIHYKGESTKKGSLNYVKVFYKAMEIFVEKHFNGNGSAYATMLKLAIWLRAGVSFASRILRNMFLPLWDFAWQYGIFVALSYLWAYLFFGNANYYEAFYREVVLLGYSAILVLSMLLCGAYKNPIQLRKTAYAYLLGLLVILAAFALMGKEWHYSRMIMVAGSVLGGLSGWLCKKVWGSLFPNYWVVGKSKGLRYLLVGSVSEIEQAKVLLLKKYVPEASIFSLQVPTEESRLIEAINVYKVSKVIFCAEELPFSQMLSWMQCVKREGAEYGSFSTKTGFRVASGLK